MDPGACASPRERGCSDGRRTRLSAHGSWSPRERGCSGRRASSRDRQAVVPARAGVFRTCRRSTRQCGARAPRASGGGPSAATANRSPSRCSPRERGCSDPSGPASGPRRAPRASGVFRVTAGEGHRACRAPRASGGVPTRTSAARAALVRPVLPARAGVFRSPLRRAAPRRRAPRASGGVPLSDDDLAQCDGCSPRERGCSVRALGPPASADWRASCSPRERGCSDAAAFRTAVPPRAPRASGGVPGIAHAVQPRRLCSPRERGCSAAEPGRAAGDLVLPARAGVFRSPRRRSAPTRRAPRASGGVPTRIRSALHHQQWSPRERGCSAPGRVLAGLLRCSPRERGCQRPPAHPRTRPPQHPHHSQ